MKKLVVLSGAGISAESGLATFRDQGGLWENYRIEEVASIEAWHRNPGQVLRFYNQRRHDVLHAEPNTAHRLLADLETHYRVHVVTQNIDDLHERAGSSSVLHLHGEILKKRSVHNPVQLYACEEDIQLGDQAPDGGQYRPHIVWFGEQVPMLQEAATLVQTADILLIIGTSLQVYPAASLIHYAPEHADKYIIDTRPAPLTEVPNLQVITASAGAGMEVLFKTLTSR